MKQAIRQLKATTRHFLRTHLDRLTSYHAANNILFSQSGVEGFFDNQRQFLLCKELVQGRHRLYESGTRREFGDFQTPNALATQICEYLADSGISPDCVVEPTCGKGAFIRAAIKQFPTLKYIYGVEIYEPYLWITKLTILEESLEFPSANKPRILLLLEDVFNFNFASITELEAESYLLLGNPPWVTNSELGSLQSQNLPQKRNFKNFSGLDAMTGKSNFDISEYITLLLLDAFANEKGNLALLLKNKVIQNIVYGLPDYPYSISNLQARAIDAKSHFDAAVEASLFTCTLATPKMVECVATTFDDTTSTSQTFGWVSGNFVADAEAYKSVARYDGRFPLVWRQGIKHDCARVMELTANEKGFVNGFEQQLDLEDTLIFGLTKSSDLREPLVKSTRKYVIVPQRTIGEDTTPVLKSYPKLSAYLHEHGALFERRKSSVYKNKPPFSIFGVGAYTFKLYKVAISGFYKAPIFSLVLPVNKKPTMTDDTCYFLSFDNLPTAIYTWAILNNWRVIRLLKALVFEDAKRPYTKQLLMRIDLNRVLQDVSFEEVYTFVTQTDSTLKAQVALDGWLSYLDSFSTPALETEQLKLL